ncbi:DUF1295 domain-containing protein [bacterium SCSIO 12696]|nr:DUF1295 domain-containing protein [bacterium SCSIO 12696]
MALAWLWQVRSNNAGIVDAVWALGISVSAFYYGFTGGGSEWLRWTVALLMGCWYLRLGVYLTHRVFTEPEDGRYQYLRQYWGKRVNPYHFLFFQFQALLIWCFSLPAWLIANGEVAAAGTQHITAVILALVAFAGVTMSDKQLAQFRSQAANKGKVCEVGLWNYSRHPNYFFEWLHWFSYPLLAIGIVGGEWLWLAPVLMLLFLIFITGIPYTEQQAIRSRGDAYLRYRETTSAFVPWKKNLQKIVESN